VRGVLSVRGVRFVVVGPLEKKDFGDDAFPLRSQFPVAFEKDGTALYLATAAPS